MNDNIIKIIEELDKKAPHVESLIDTIF